MSNTQWRTVRAVAVALVTFLLVQPLVLEQPLVMLVLGCINVALAATNIADDPEDGNAGE